jgi:DNA invertase Pin-like site-specific DNA recombinase
MQAALYIGPHINDFVISDKISKLSEFAYFKKWDYQIFRETINDYGSRPIKEELMSLLLRKDFEVVMVYRFSDWSITSIGLMEEINKLVAKEIRFFAYYENFDSSTQTGILFLKVLSSCVELEQSLISEPLKRLSGEGAPATQKSKVLNFHDLKQANKTTSIPDFLDYQKSNFDLVDMNGAVLLTGYSKHALYSMTCRREIPFIKRPGGRKVFFSKLALQEWIINGPDKRNHKRRSYSS